MPPARAPVGGGNDAGKRTDLLVAAERPAARLVLHREAEGVLEDRARRARRDDGEERDDVDVLLDELLHRRLRVVVRDDGEVAVVARKMSLPNVFDPIPLGLIGTHLSVDVCGTAARKPTSSHPIVDFLARCKDGFSL